LNDPLNLACFSERHWKVIAQGFQTETWFEDGQAIGTGGIVNPNPEDLRVGQKYYRFASATSNYDAQVGGGWWIDYENFATIRGFANRHGYGLEYAARLFLALPYAWTRVDRLVTAILEVPLRAYAGHGKVASLSSEKWTPRQHLKVRQLYIPGLYRRGARTQLYETAFPKPQINYVATMKPTN